MSIKMNIQNKDQWYEAFLKACRVGKLEDVRHLCQKQYLDKGWADIHANDVDNGLCRACYHGQLEVVQYLLTSPELIEAGHTFAEIDGFRWACAKGHLNVVRYLLTSPELKEAGYTFANLHADFEDGFRWACAKGHLNVVRYLLTSPELKEAGYTFANLHADDEDGFCKACANGHLEVVKYLLSSPDLIEAGHSFANVHANDDDGFRLACANEHWDVMRWLIMDHGIEKTYAIEEIIQRCLQFGEEHQTIQGVLQDFLQKNDEKVAKKAKKL